MYDFWDVRPHLPVRLPAILYYYYKKEEKEISIGNRQSLSRCCIAGSWERERARAIKQDATLRFITSPSNWHSRWVYHSQWRSYEKKSRIADKPETKQKILSPRAPTMKAQTYKHKAVVLSFYFFVFRLSFLLRLASSTPAFAHARIG